MSKRVVMVSALRESKEDRVQEASVLLLDGAFRGQEVQEHLRAFRTIPNSNVKVTCLYDGLIISWEENQDSFVMFRAVLALAEQRFTIDSVND